MIFLFKSLLNWGYDNVANSNTRVTKLWSHDHIYNIIRVTWHKVFHYFIFFLSFINSTTNSEVFSRVTFLEIKINKCFKYVQILCVLFFWLYHSLATEKKPHFPLLTLHHIRHGALPLDGCLHAARYFLCSELRHDAVFAANKTQIWHASFPCFFFSTLFHSKF